jgi:hypothetical protein
MSNELECGIWDKEGICLVPIANLEELPLYHRETIPIDYWDDPKDGFMRCTL